MDLTQAIGQVVRIARTQSGLTQHQLAERVGLHWTAIGKIEQGKRQPRFETLELVAGGLHMPTWELIRQAAELKTMRGEPPVREAS